MGGYGTRNPPALWELMFLCLQAVGAFLYGASLFPMKAGRHDSPPGSRYNYPLFFAEMCFFLIPDLIPCPCPPPCLFFSVSFDAGSGYRGCLPIRTTTLPVWPPLSTSSPTAPENPPSLPPRQKEKDWSYPARAAGDAAESTLTTTVAGAVAVARRRHARWRTDRRQAEGEQSKAGPTEAGTSTAWRRGRRGGRGRRGEREACRGRHRRRRRLRLTLLV